MALRLSDLSYTVLSHDYVDEAIAQLSPAAQAIIRRQDRLQELDERGNVLYVPGYSNGTLLRDLPDDAPLIEVLALELRVAASLLPAEFRAQALQRLAADAEHDLITGSSYVDALEDERGRRYRDDNTDDNTAILCGCAYGALTIGAFCDGVVGPVSLALQVSMNDLARQVIHFAVSERIYPYRFERSQRGSGLMGLIELVVMSLQPRERARLGREHEGLERYAASVGSEFYRSGLTSSQVNLDAYDRRTRLTIAAANEALRLLPTDLQAPCDDAVSAYQLPDQDEREAPEDLLVERDFDDDDDELSFDEDYAADEED